MATSLQQRNEEVLFRRYSVVFISLLLVFVVVLSIFIFTKQSLRLDEAQSLWQTSRTPLKMISIVAQDVHVPLYHLLLHFWQFIFGNSVVMARMLSLLFTLLSIPTMYLLGKLAYNRFVGLFGALLLAISPFFNWYGNEIRMYSLFAFLTIVNQYFFIKIFKSKDYIVKASTWWGFGISTILGMFTHYFFALAMLAQFVFFFLYKNKFPEHSLRKFIAVAVISAALFAPWVYYVMSMGGASNSQPMLIKPTTINLFNTFSQFLFGFQDDHLNTIIVSLWPISILLVFLSLRKGYKINPETVYFFLSMILPIGITFIVSTSLRPIFVTRYLILTLPSLYLMVSWLFSTYPKRLSRVLKILLVLIMLATLGVEAVSATTPVKENYREAVEYLTARTRPQDIIVVSAPFTIYPIEYYYHGQSQIVTLPLWDRYVTGPIPPFSEEKLPEEVTTIKGDHQILWLLLSYDQGYEEKIKLYFDKNFEKIDQKNFSPGLNLYAYKLRYDVDYIDKIAGISTQHITATTTPVNVSRSVIK